MIVPDYTDLIARLRTMNGIGDIQLNELMNRKTPLEAAGAIEDQGKRIAELESRLEFNPEAPGIDGIYCRDETIRLQEARIAELDSKVIACNSKLRESQGMADCMAMVRQEMIDAGVLSSVIPPAFMPESIIPRLKALDAIRALLPDDLYSHSKDWSSGDLAYRIEWLKIGYESEKSLVRDFMTQLDDIWKQSPIGEVTHSDVLPGDDGLYRYEFRSSERIGLQAELFAQPVNTRLLDAAKTVLCYTHAECRTPVRDEIECGRMTTVRVHALADLHEAVQAAKAQQAKPVRMTDEQIKDAERYAYLRSQHEGEKAECLCVFEPGTAPGALAPVGSMPGELDATIDAAMRANGLKVED